MVLLGFLAIPKGLWARSDLILELISFVAKRKVENTAQFRKFRRQLFHSSIAAILRPLIPYMTTPDIVKCADGHYRRIIYSLGPYIADYPEQVLLAAVVSGRCVRFVFVLHIQLLQCLIFSTYRCTASAKDLDAPGSMLRCREHTESCIENLEPDDLWDVYGIVGDVVVSIYISCLLPR